MLHMPFFVLEQRSVDRFQQGLAYSRLLEEIFCARLHRHHTGFDVALAGEVDDRQQRRFFREMLLAVQAPLKPGSWRSRRMQPGSKFGKCARI